MSLVELAAAQHGTVARSQLREIGLPAGTIDRWVAVGRLVILHRGVYLVAAPIEPLRAREMAALLACG